MKILRITIITIILFFLCALISEFIFGKGIPFVFKEKKWSIGIYTGRTPFSLSSSGKANPVLTASDVTDVSARFIADPFMVKENGKWYMFFEIMNNKTGQGDIGVAVSNDGFIWKYQQVVLDEPFHLSYPYVFKWGKDYYMIPETSQTYSVRLYKAVNFPVSWECTEILLSGEEYVDPSIVFFEDRWWLFASLPNSDVLYLYYAYKLEGPWFRHPNSPIIKNNMDISRPGGRVIVFNDRVIRYAQDDSPTYENEVNAFEVTEITTTSYRERKIENNPVLGGSGNGWNKIGMHQVDAHKLGKDKWIACVDGFGGFRLVYEGNSCVLKRIKAHFD